MTEKLLLACPHCHAVNRLERARLNDDGRCGKCGGALFAAEPVELDGASFDIHAGRSELPLLVDFWAPWCGPCRSMAPSYAAAARQLEPAMRLGKVNTEAEQALAARFGIRSIPTLILFHKGREVARQAGAMDTAGIVRWATRAAGG